MKERLKRLRKALDLTQQEFADRIGISRGNIATYETREGSPGSSVINLICREFNVSETWLRTGEGEMFIPSPNGALELLAREYELSPGMYILIKRLLALKPENQQAAVDFAVKLAEDLNNLDAAPVVISKTGTITPAPDASGQERTEPDIMAKLAELERQNQELAAKVAAMEEEDALYGLTGGSSISPTASAGSLDPVKRVKK